METISLCSNDIRRKYYFSNSVFISSKIPSMYIQSGWNGLTAPLQENKTNTCGSGTPFNGYNSFGYNVKNYLKWGGLYHPQDGSGNPGFIPILCEKELNNTHTVLQAFSIKTRPPYTRRRTMRWRSQSLILLK